MNSTMNHTTSVIEAELQRRARKFDRLLAGHIRILHRLANYHTIPESVRQQIARDLRCANRVEVVENESRSTYEYS
jgi:hypothetical protein